MIIADCVLVFYALLFFVTAFLYNSESILFLILIGVIVNIVGIVLLIKKIQ
jgi:hypothetical protein